MSNQVLDAAKNTNIDKDISNSKYILTPDPERPWYGLRAGEKYQYATTISPKGDGNFIVKDSVYSYPEIRCYRTDPEWDKSVESEDWQERRTAVDMGYGLDILIKDEDHLVRKHVAKYGYGFDILINDEDGDVRREVAKHGYGLDILIHDESYWVRKMVAMMGYGLDVLINDSNQDVRESVARKGYGLNKLINSHFQATLLTKAYLYDHNLRLEEWMEKYPERVYNGKFRYEY